LIILAYPGYAIFTTLGISNEKTAEVNKLARVTARIDVDELLTRYIAERVFSQVWTNPEFYFFS